MENQFGGPPDGVLNGSIHSERRDPKKERQVIPWLGIIQNITRTKLNGEDVIPGGELEDLKFLKDLNPRNADVFHGTLGQPGWAGSIKFKRDETGYNNAVTFHQFFKKRGHYRKHWLNDVLIENRRGCDLYGRLANEDDYYGRNGSTAVPTYLQATVKLMEIRPRRSKTDLSIQDEKHQPGSLKKIYYSSSSILLLVLPNLAPQQKGEAARGAVNLEAKVSTVRERRRKTDINVAESEIFSNVEEDSFRGSDRHRTCRAEEEGS